LINWENHFRKTEQPEWCGPAVIQMILSVADIEIEQKQIAKNVLIPWWGTPQQIMLAYLSVFFKIVNYKINAKYKDISYHLKKENIIVVNWWDEDDGHYSIVDSYQNKEITLIDPSRGKWNLTGKDFNTKWYDTIDMNNRAYIDGWMLWVDIKSKILDNKGKKNGFFQSC
jgi:ABC-type bacteriocin/lantibiotic exporter with double-glycine peptidase domain